MIPTSCNDARILSRAITVLGQIEDLLQEEGAEQELHDLTEQIELPSFQPKVASNLDEFVTDLKGSRGLTMQQAIDFTEDSEGLRKDLSQFLIVATSECLIAHLLA